MYLKRLFCRFPNQAIIPADANIYKNNSTATPNICANFLAFSFEMARRPFTTSEIAPSESYQRANPQQSGNHY